jgi:hypothetical protein
MKKVSIIILNWNGKPHLKNCLESIKRNTKYPNYEVIITDQGSKDGSVEMLEKEYPWVRLIKNPKNYGIPKGTNQAFAIAKGEYFFLLGNDTLVTPKWLENAVKILESDRRICTVGSTQINADTYHNKKYTLKNTLRKRANVNSVGMLIRRKVYERIGGYDEANFSPYGGDETDWNFRATNLGYKIVEAGNVVIAHLHSTDTKRQNPNQYLLLNEHRLKAMLYNLSFLDFLKRIPGLGLIFINSFKRRQTLILLRSYWNNVRNWQNILDEKKKRKEITKRLKEEQRRFGEEWF